MLYFQESEDTVWVYRLDISDDPMSDLSWVDWDDIASSSGVDIEEIEEAAKSGNVIARAQIYEAVAGYYGWNEFDQEPETLTLEKAEEKYDDDVNEAHQEGQRRRKSKKNPSKFEIGDLVKPTTKFMRSIGKVTTRDGIVVGHGSIGPWVIWQDDDLPVQINAANIQKKRSKRSPKDLLGAARLGTDLPLGTKRDGFWIYRRDGKTFKHVADHSSYGQAESAADQLNDKTGKDVVVLDPEGYVQLAMRGTKSNPKRKTRRTARAVNPSFDPRTVRPDAESQRLQTMAQRLSRGDNR